MWCKRILVAYDGSAPSRKALELASQIASQDCSIEVVLVHVMRLYSSGSAAIGMDTIVMDDASEVLDELQSLADGLSNPATVELLKGTSPADLIVEHAKRTGCDLIIMGSRGKGGVKGYLGSVSYAVTKESPVTVLIAKEGDAR